ncbi:MAG: ABC transporter permease [Actinomycetota bacterium]|nr:ABC transporter permease [Actinomycetota bacterium]
MKRIASRLLQAVLVMLGVTTVMFALLRAVPGDPAAVIAGPAATPAVLAAVRAQYHLNQPLVYQYGHWISSLLSGNLGTSLTYQEPVVTLIRQALGPTLQLVIVSMVIGVSLGVLLGVFAATHLRKAPDLIVSGFSSGVLGMPSFWMGLLLLLVFSVDLHWVPSGGSVSILSSPVEGLKTVALPAITLGLGVAAVQARFVRTAMVEALSGDYVRTARAKGASERAVVWKHALRNALLPLITITGIQVGILLGGVVVIEDVFARPGLGSVIATAIANRDYPVVEGTTVVLVAAFSAVNLVVDIAYQFIDPRIRR